MADMLVAIIERWC